MSPNHGASDPANPTLTRILVIDDEPEMLKNYQRLLKRAGHDCMASGEPAETPDLLRKFRPECVITDLVMPEVSGMDVLQHVKSWDPSVPVIIVSAYGSIEGAVLAMKNHAADFLVKPFSMNELLQKVQEALSSRMIDQAKDVAPEPENKTPDGYAGIIGVSPAMQVLFDRLRKVARLDVNVLVTGESGTGKELVARAIHNLSPRRKEILVPIDCASLPEHLLESELFGYSKGSFTGAHADRKGLLEFAHKGTLFLDEVGEIPPALQVKLLRVLQERSFRPIGKREQVEVNIRVVAATNRNLEEEVREKNFRSDLLYRLNVVGLHLPPLRERREDIALLANFFLRQFVQEQNLPAMHLLPEAMLALQRYAWPGNVRELQNSMEHAATLATNPALRVENLPPEVQGDRRIEVPAIDDAAANSFFEVKGQLVAGFEREYLVNLLASNNFNVSKAAQAAGCHRRTLYRMIDRYRIDLDAIRREHRNAARNGANANAGTTAGK